MNLKHINRKQQLGISHSMEFSDWALMLENAPGKKTLNTTKLINSLYLGDFCWTPLPSDYMKQKVHPPFNGLVKELGLDFKHSEMEDTWLARAVQSMHSEACKQELCLNIIDLRPIPELGTSLSDIELLDKMVIECGCNPIGEHWIEYSADDGRQTLQILFEQQVVPTTPIISERFESNVLAGRFLSHFDDTVRLYGNDCYAPWFEGRDQKHSATQSKPLQSRFDSDFGLVLRDSKHIGFLFVAQDYF